MWIENSTSHIPNSIFTYNLAISFTILFQFEVFWAQNFTVFHHSLAKLNFLGEIWHYSAPQKALDTSMALARHLNV